MFFLSNLENNVMSFPNRIAVCKNHKDCLLTYDNLWKDSGRVYNWLIKNEIRKEDFVLINMPRDPRAYACVIGVMRAGAAFVVAENTYPLERVEFIKKDSNAKIVIDEDSYVQILNETPLDGYKARSNHDAAFAVYTSGTTGTPKGVLHEYGNIDLEVSYYKSLIKNTYEKFASILSFNFVAFVMELTWQLTLGNSIYILDDKISKNLNKLIDFINSEKIESLHMPPSLVRNINCFPKSVKRIMIGTEPANGIFFDNIEITNKYAQSETYFTIANIKLDKKYDKAPVGKNPHGKNIKILSDEGVELEDGLTGEICFKNEFFRGYINLPEQTKYAFRDGIYHTGDLGYKDSFGNLVISGRKDDMIKINGYRIEPAEIEAAGKKLLGVTQTISKGFIEDDGRSYVVLYYVRDNKSKKFSREDESKILNKFSDILPAYMTPSYLIEIDKIPTVPNGKADRKALKKPNIDSFKTEYVAPIGNTEKILCDIFSKVLNIDKVGVNDDFYMLGGDSITCMEAVNSSGLINLTTGDIFKGRTVSKIAKIYDNKKNDNHNIDSSIDIQKELVKNRNKENYFRFSKTGIVESKYSLMFLVNFEVPKDPDSGIVLEYTLEKLVNYKKLQSSVNYAIKICPYITFDINVRKELPIVQFKKNNKPLIVRRYKDKCLFGSDENNGHYVLISYDKYKVKFSVSHVLTDGNGLMRFIKIVFDYYFDIEQNNYIDMDKSSSSITDLMAEQIPLSENEKKSLLHIQQHNNLFKITEVQSYKKEEFLEKSIIIKKDKFYKFVNKYELSAQLAIALLVCVSIQNTRKENNNDIGVRIPVDSRIVLGAKDTFQNSSYPHIVLSLKSEDLRNCNFSKLANSLKVQFDEQYSYPYLAEFTNKVSSAIKSSDINDIANFLSWYVGLSDVFVSYLGKLDSDNWCQHIKNINLLANPGFKLTIYMYEYKDCVCIKYVQSVINDEYFKNFIKLIDLL